MEGCVRYLAKVRQIRARNVILYSLVFALCGQPFTMFAPSTYALTSSIVINEFSANGSNDWVELYNPTSESIDLADWKLRDSTVSNVRNLSGALMAKSFLVVDLSNALNALSDTIRLLDGTGNEVNVVDYAAGSDIPYPASGQSTARAYDGGVVWAAGQPTKGTVNDTEAPAKPADGAPHMVTKLTTDFDFSWEVATDPQGSAVTYQVRVANQPFEINESAIWYSSYISTPTLSAATVANIGNGAWYWQTRSQDTTGNISDWSEEWRVTIDTIDPTIVIRKPTTSSLHRDVVDFEATITERELSSFTVERDGVNITDNVTTTPTEAGVSLAAAWDAHSLGEGIHTIVIRAHDAAGRMSEAARNFEVDTIAPLLVSSLRQNSVLRGVTVLDVSSNVLDLESLHITVTSSSGEVIELAAGGEEEGLIQGSLRQEWDTRHVQDGMYTVRMSGADIAGNEAVLLRTITVSNMIFGGVGAVPKDPLLEQLSVSLRQPFATANIFTTPTASLGSTPVEDIRVIPVDSTPINGLSLPPVAATENGWRIFGILWYWWMLIILLTGSFGIYSWRLVKRRQFSDTLDNA